MHYFEDPWHRERLLVEDVARVHWSLVAPILGLSSHRQSVFTHLPKSLYQMHGDVDIAVWSDRGTNRESLIAIEVKTLYLRRDGKLKSQKAEKHQKQLLQLLEDGWDYVWLFDFIVTEPAPGWMHAQSFDGFSQHSKHVAPGFGHAVFQFNAVEGRPEADAGSIGQRLLTTPSRIDAGPERSRLLDALGRISPAPTSRA